LKGTAGIINFHFCDSVGLHFQKWVDHICGLAE
jgi:hypothetical protein